MDVVSFSEDTDDSFPSDSLRESICHVSRRLEFESEEIINQKCDRPPQKPARRPRRLPVTERSSPDGSNIISFQRSSISTTCLTRPRASIDNSSIPSHLRSFSQSLPHLYATYPHQPSLAALSTLSELSLPSSEKTSEGDPIDLSNGPLDLRTNSKKNIQLTSPTSPLSVSPRNTQWFTEQADDFSETVDSFDSVVLLSQRHANLITPETVRYATNLNSPEEIIDVTTLESSLKSDVSMESVSGIIEHDNLNSSLETTDTTDVKLALSKEIASTVKAIVTSSISVFSPCTTLSHPHELNKTFNIDLERLCSKSKHDVSNYEEKKQVDDAPIVIEESLFSPIEVDPDSSLINKGAPALFFAMPEELPASSLTNNLPAGKTSTSESTWSVKEAVDSLHANSLKLTFSRTPPSHYPTRLMNIKDQYPPVAPLDTWPIFIDTDLDSKLSGDSLHFTRNVIGSSICSEESTISSESSQVVPFENATVVSHPSTPDITTCTSPNYVHNSACLPTFPDSHVQNSTPREKRSGNNTNFTNIRLLPGNRPTTKKDSPRKMLLKQKALECQGSDSILNIGFRHDSYEEKSSKRNKDKNSLFKVLKRQVLCTKDANMSETTVYPEPEIDNHQNCVSSGKVKAVKSGRSRNNIASKFKLKPCSVILGNCFNANDTLPTTLYQTLTESSWGLTTWCKHIRDLSRIAATSEHIVPEQLNETHKLSDSSTVNVQKASKWTDNISVDSLGDKASQDSKPSATCDAFHQNSSLVPNVPLNGDETLKPGHFKMPLPQDQFTPPKFKSKSKLTLPREKCCARFQDMGNNPISSSTPLRSVRVLSPRQGLIQSSTPLNKKSGQDEESDVRIDLMDKICRETAEYLAAFVSDESKKIMDMKTNIQAKRRVITRLCQRCNIKMTVPKSDPLFLRLKKRKSSRVPTEADIQHLVRSIRRNSLISLI